MYSLYRQTHPPTGVEHCVYCHFFNYLEKNLVIAVVNQIYVYRLYNDESLESNSKEQDKIPDTKKKLECLASFSLLGNVMSLKCVNLPGAHREALLLSFSDAKLAVVEYDPATHDLQTTSLHYFEEPQLKDGFATNYYIPTIRVDPDNRCAAMLIYGSRLVILPFRRDAPVEDTEISASSGTNKSPILSSYIIDLKSFDEKIIHVVDFQFLYGYFEPTLFILFEPLKTWSGRTAIRADTCSIVAISLNMLEKVHPIIWSLSNLPFDCTQALAVTKPIGGVLVFAVNSLLYLNQSVPPYGVALNSIANSSTSFPIKTQENIRIALDCTQATFIDFDKLVLSLRGGELYVLTLVVDGTRCVRSFHFDKAAASVLTTCICICDAGYLFLGSRLGNSLLLKYTEKDIAEVKPEPEKKSEPQAKKRKLDGNTDMASDAMQAEALYDLEVYGTAETQAGTMITSFSFEVCDNIWNIAPCGNVTLGEPAFLSEEFTHNVDPDLEIVTTSGYGKNGALSVLQKSIRPQVVTTFELPGCIDMWTVRGPEPPESEDTEKKSQSEEERIQEEKEKPGLENGHSFLILSRGESTMILRTGEEIMELDHSGFCTQSTTVYAGNICDKYILQVSPTGIRLLEGVKQLQHIPMDSGSPLIGCSVADPYILINSEDGTVLSLTLRQELFGRDSVRLTVSRPSLPLKPKIITMCVYKDVSGIFTTAMQSHEVSETFEQKASKTDHSFNMDQSNIEDEDELLYGESDKSVFSSSFETSKTEPSVPVGEQKKSSSEIKPTFWALICRETGVLEIYSLPDFKLCYYVQNFPMGQKVLVDSVRKMDSTGSTSGSGMQDKATSSDLPVVKELLMVGLGNKQSRPYLMARVENELYVYEAFPYFQTPTENRLKLRFRKFHHSLILRERKITKSKKKTEEGSEETSLEMTSKHLRFFEDICGYSGVFVCGLYPHWLFITPRGSLRIHPMSIDGPINCFAPFHNVNCPNGFLYFNKQGELRICVLLTHLTYDAHWPIRKVPLRCTPHYVAYHPESKNYAVVTSIPEPCNKFPRITTDEREIETIIRDERFIYPGLEKFSMQLFSPTTWEVIPNTRVDVEEWEQVTTMKLVNLRSEETISGLKGYMVMGTNYSYGEEVTSRGRVLIVDIIDVVPEPGLPLTKNKLKVIYDKEQKGPVTAVAGVNGLLVTATGQKIYIWELKDNDLRGVAFIDTQIYIVSLVTIKTLIMAGDILKSISLFRYQEDLRVLSIVSRDVKNLEVYTIDFMVDNNQLGMIVSDRMKNIIIYTYQPEARESHGGQRLLRKADFNIGSHVNSMFRIPCKLSELSMDKKAMALLEKRHITYFASLDGSLGYFLPLSEKVYRRLLMVQNALITHIPHVAGLNPKSYRTQQSTFPELRNTQRNILDGELIWKFTNLSLMERAEISKRIGTTSNQVLDDLREIDRMTAHF